MSKSASTVSLSILVVIEMLNAMNALSSSESLLTFCTCGSGTELDMLATHS
jgi:hypothetical protein